MGKARRDILVATLAGVGACALLLAAWLFMPEFSFPALQPAPMGPSRTASVMIACGVLYPAWCISACWRCSDAKIRLCIIAITALFTLWMLVVLVKYPSPSSLVTSMCWYLFYVPRLFVPVLCLRCALRAAALDALPAVRRAMRIIFCISGALVLLILTNNLHQGAFVLDFADGGWDGSYAYAPGYWVAVGWEVALYAAFFVVLFAASRKQLRSVLLPIAVVACLAVVYGLMYTFRIGMVHRSNLALTYSFFVVLALEFCFDFKILPSYARYGEVFRKLPFDLKVLSLDLGRAFATNRARPLDPAVAQALGKVDVPDLSFVSFKMPSDERTAYKAYRLRGGVALLAEDLATVNERRAQLESRGLLLQRQNVLLEQDRIVQGRLHQQASERELFEEVERSLSASMGEIREILAGLSCAAEAEDRERRRRQLVMVRLLVAYCKRKGGLVLAEKGDPDFDRERLQLIVNEGAVDLRSAGIDCAALVEISEVLPAATVGVLYDCFYDFALVASTCANPVLMFYIHESRQSRECVELRIVLECEGEEDLSQKETVARLRVLLDARDVAYRLTGQVGTLSLVVVAARAREGGEPSRSSGTDAAVAALAQKEGCPTAACVPSRSVAPLAQERGQG